MPKPLTTIALTCALAAAPAWAQRGGAMGHGGSFAAHSPGNSPAFHAGPALTGRANFTAPSHFNFNGVARVAAAPFFNRRYLHDDRDHHAYARPYPVFVPYGVNGWGAPAYVDPGLYDDSSAASSPPAYTAAESQDTAPPPPEQADTQPEIAPAPTFRPAYVRPQPQPGLIPDTPVTLIFKDGRPSEQIHNYMLTRTTLYVQEQHLRRIPVDQLDLDATVKANADAGVHFSLPGIAR